MAATSVEAAFEEVLDQMEEISGTAPPDPASDGSEGWPGPEGELGLDLDDDDDED